MRILVLGSGGMAGHVISQYMIEQGHEVTTTASKTRFNENTVIVNALDSKTLSDFLGANNFNVIINCIGILVKESEDRKDLASFLNGYLPHYLENLYKDSATKIIHLSTDCVFSGENPPYNEDSEYDGQTFYDRSKALGEINNDKDLTFRMSIIGPDITESGTGLFNWFMAQAGETLGFTNAIWTGVTTITLAKAIDSAIKQNLTGIYHLVPNANMSKYDLLNVFKDVFGKNITINADDRKAPNKTLINNRSDFDFTVPGYEEMVKEMYTWVKEHGALYKHYKVEES